jgi:hypothetical protein
MTISFVKGDWFDVEPGELLEARISNAQSAALPRNWQTMPDEDKWAWSEANKGSVITACHIYKAGFCLGELMDKEAVSEIASMSGYRNGVAVVMQAPYSYDPDVASKGHVVKVYTGLWAADFTSDVVARLSSKAQRTRPAPP